MQTGRESLTWTEPPAIGPPIQLDFCKHARSGHQAVLVLLSAENVLKGVPITVMTVVNQILPCVENTAQEGLLYLRWKGSVRADEIHEVCTWQLGTGARGACTPAAGTGFVHGFPCRYQPLVV